MAQWRSELTIRNLEYAVNPRSVAVIGASIREGSVGRVVLSNIVEGGFRGTVWGVNPKYDRIGEIACHRDVRSLPAAPDLAVIVTPAVTVPGLVSELAAKGCRAAVVISAGLTHANGLRQAMLDAARPHLFRIIGPNTLGLMMPAARLNASFAHMAPRPGGIALLSQSGAIATSLIDWAAENNVGFSQIVSLGDMADVDVGDWLDLLAGDRRTRSIILYLESITAPRKFISAARAASRIKPVIAIKAGRHAAAAAAAATHTGALSGADRVVEAVLRRAGILRVQSLAELFDAAEITAQFPALDHARLAIVTNGGGAGVLAVDRLMDRGGELAELSPETLARLEAAMPPAWSRANPVDIIGDAPPERFVAAIEAVADDPSVDALMVMNCPTGLASPIDAARGVAEISDKGRIAGKPVISCWLGEHVARHGREILQNAGIPSFETPAKAADAASHLWNWAKARQALSRVPSRHSEDVEGKPEVVARILREVADEGRRMLTEPEAKAVIEAYCIPVPETRIARSPGEAESVAEALLARHRQVAVKLLSKAITHKSDVGGVMLGISSAREAGEAARTIVERVRRSHPEAKIEGFAVQPMVMRKHAQELILGCSRDPVFGPVIAFGAGGVAVEVLDDIAIGLPPLDDVLVAGLVRRTRIGRLLAGFRDRAPIDHGALSTALNGLSQLIVDFPCIHAVDVNPLLANKDGVIALDARIEIEPARIDEPGPNPDLVIRPYPSEWTRTHVVEDETFLIRPIKPADIVLYPPFIERISSGDIRYRFLAPRRHFPDEMLKRLTQLDYDRDIAFAAIREASGELAAVGRLSLDPDRTIGEYALLVRSDLQGRGLGWVLLKHILDYATAEGLEIVEGVILADNDRMISMCRSFGFEIAHEPDEPGVVRAIYRIGPRRGTGPIPAGSPHSGSGHESAAR